MPTHLELTPESDPILSRRPPKAAGRPDGFQTPPVALAPLLPHLDPQWLIWEPACGSGNLSDALRTRGHRVTATDILTGHDFFLTSMQFDAIVTNPPFSQKDEWLGRCYRLGKPFALLMPLTALEGRRRQALYRKHGVEVIFLDRRVSFETPSGRGSSSWFPTAWFTWGLGVGRQMTFAFLPPARGGQQEALCMGDAA